MKRILFSVLMVGLLAGPAFASMYNLDVYWEVVKGFTNYRVSPSDYGKLNLVIANPGTQPGSTIYYKDLLYPLNKYGTTMQLAVGFVGDLGDVNGGGAWMEIYAADPAGLGLSGGYNQFGGTIANDDDDPWTVEWYLIANNVPQYTGPVLLAAGGQDFVQSGLFGMLNFQDVTEIGIKISSGFTGGSPSNPDSFHISAVPTPAAVLLGLLGLGAAGLGLRKFA